MNSTLWSSSSPGKYHTYIYVKFELLICIKNHHIYAVITFCGLHPCERKGGLAEYIQIPTINLISKYIVNVFRLISITISQTKIRLRYPQFRVGGLKVKMKRLFATSSIMCSYYHIARCSLQLLTQETHQGSLDRTQRFPSRKTRSEGGNLPEL